MIRLAFWVKFISSNSEWKPRLFILKVGGQVFDMADEWVSESCCQAKGGPLCLPVLLGLYQRQLS